MIFFLLRIESHPFRSSKYARINQLASNFRISNDSCDPNYFIIVCDKCTLASMRNY